MELSAPMRQPRPPNVSDQEKGSTMGYMLCCPGCVSKDSFFDESHLLCPKYWLCYTLRHQKQRWLRPRPYWRFVNCGTVCTSAASFHRSCCTLQLCLVVSSSPWWWRWNTIYDPELKVGYIQLDRQWDAATLLPIIQRRGTRDRLVWQMGSLLTAGMFGVLALDSQPHGVFQGSADWHAHWSRRGVLTIWHAVKWCIKTMCSTTNEMVLAYLDEHVAWKTWADGKARHAQSAASHCWVLPVSLIVSSAAALWATYLAVILKNAGMVGQTMGQ